MRFGQLLVLLVGVWLWADSSSAELPDWRQQALDAVRAGANKRALLSAPESAERKWRLTGTLYPSGAAAAHEAVLGSTLEQAGHQLGREIAARVSAEVLRTGRLFLSVRGPGAVGLLVEYQGEAIPVVGDVTVVPAVNRERILATVRAQKEYLLRQIDPKYHAFFKVYSARRDQRQEVLRVTYTASALWTLLQMRDLEPDARIDAIIEPAIEFLFSMQVMEGPHAGAFHYSINGRTGVKRERFVVGTTAKTVFTLLELHRRTKESRFLTSARRAGDWLLSQVQKDGRLQAESKRHLLSGEWVTNHRHSVLYSAEVLSALSQLARVTGERKYRRPASRIAKRLVKQGADSGWVYGDDYRMPNTISTSWVAMALLDYTRIDQDPSMSKALFTIAHQVRSRQITKTPRLLDDGRYFDIWATSGNGWMNEVLVPVYERCVAERREHCEQFRLTINRSARWLIQNTYSAENSYHIPNPERAHGGAIRNDQFEQVRTDAVCHAANSLIGMLRLKLAPD
jgi:hypothetical protein